LGSSAIGEPMSDKTEEMNLLAANNQQQPPPGQAVMFANPLAQRIYGQAPWHVQNLLISLYGLDLRRKAARRPFQEKFQGLMESQWWSAGELQALQEERLRALVAHAYEHVPYYRRVFDERGLRPEDIQQVSDLHKLPFLSKETVRDNLGELIADNVDASKLVLHYTSGSTGAPLKVYWDRNCMEMERAVVWRHKHWGGWRPESSRASAGGLRVVPLEQNSAPPWRYSWSEKRLFLSGYHLDPENLQEYVGEMKRRRLEFLEGYPTNLYILASFLKQEGDYIPFKAVFTSSETLYKHQRELIEERFQCQVFDFYGLTERAASAQECGEHSGHHVNVENTVLEIISPNGEEARPGESGEIVGTCLSNYAMPIIRYRTHDLAVAGTGRQCPCGRGLPLLQQIGGRLNDIITTPDGRWLSPLILIAPFKYIAAVREYRIVQEALDRVVVQIVQRNGYSAQDTQKLLGELQSIIGTEVTISIEFVDNIPWMAGGKHPFVVSKVPLQI
jgi:phenylacetate-CoA ligase